MKQQPLCLIAGMVSSAACTALVSCQMLWSHLTRALAMTPTRCDICSCCHTSDKRLNVTLELLLESHKEKSPICFSSP